MAALIDHTLLKADATAAAIEALCGEAVAYGFATVCVNPSWVPLATRILEGSGVGVCSVVAFPLGATLTDVKAFEARRAVDAGAREIDVVQNLGALKSGDLGLVARDLEAAVHACHGGGALTKVIIEAGLLTDAEKVTACTLAREAGADFVKTSTGFRPGGATADDVALMRRTVGEAMGVKAAGGIRDLAGLRAMVVAGATRIGSSGGVRIMREAEELRLS